MKIKAAYWQQQIRRPCYSEKILAAVGLTKTDITDSYFRHFDIEHFFRFGKQKLLLTSFQTPDVRHEENWWWLCIVSYAMPSKIVGESRQKSMGKNQTTTHSKEILNPSQVQRNYERIIREIGTPACDPKLRGKSLGRQNGVQLGKRKDCKVNKKGKPAPKKKLKAAA